MKRLLKIGLLGYLALLALSYVVWLLRSPTPLPPPGMRTVEVPEYAGHEKLERTVTLRYWDHASSGRPAPTVVLIHGSPVGSSAMQPLVEALPAHYRLLVPDLPGFGASEQEVEDYSFTAHAHYVLELMDALDLPEAQIVAYSMGGGVALQMAEIAPERVSSIAMVSAIGVQAYELFGNYELNHSVHWAQWIALGVVQYAVPHFGFFEQQPLDLEYARNFLDSDQRPLRGILQQYAGPMLIQHGREDPFVPLQAAQEHHRLVPQSELRLYAGGHLLAINQPARLVPDLTAFIDRVARGQGIERPAAPAERQAAAARPFQRDRSWRYVGVAAVLVFVLLALATMVSEDLTCIGAGFLAANGLISLPTAIGACFTGIVIGDTLLYLLGRGLGRAALRRRPARWFVSEGMERRAEAWFHRRGPIIIVASRFLPGTRAATYFTAGVLKAPFWQFFLLFALAALVWTPFLVTLSSRLGESMMRLYEAYEAWALPAIALGIVALILVVQWILPMSTWRGRRLTLGKWRRMTRWEFWPLWRVNAPVLLYGLWLAFTRYRHAPAVCSVCNPAIPASGLIGESKSAILRGLAGAGDAVARWTLLPKGAVAVDERRARLERWQAQLPQPWPLVLKPDAGQRGAGVVIARDRAAVEAVLEQLGQSWIAQEYVPGEEFGVFYVRRPGEAAGRIISITHKRMPEVIGDGKSTMEELILRDDRTVCLAPMFLEAWADRLESVPAADERVKVVEIGTHARGALFLDAGHLLTPQLTAAVERIAQNFEGFFFGRFDFRVPSVEAFRRGEGLRVLELNGLTSECTHIYDPRHSVWHAWRVLCAQWRLAMEIGEANRQRGHQPLSLRAFWRSFREGARRQAE